MRHRYTTRDKKTAKTRHQLSHLFLGFLPVGSLSFEHGRHGRGLIRIADGGRDNGRRFLQYFNRIAYNVTVRAADTHDEGLGD